MISRATCTRPSWRCTTETFNLRILPLATPNYGFEKRQRELAKKQKKEEKLRAKAERKTHGDGASDDPQGSDPQGQADPSAASDASGQA
jgi:hypothetical protein